MAGLVPAISPRYARPHRINRDRRDKPGSEVYVRNKSKAVAEAGMHAFDHKLPSATSEAELLGVIARLNADEEVNGILVQLPLPKQIDAHKIIAAIDPAK